MEPEYRDNMTKQIPVFKLDIRRNKMEFIRGFKQVASGGSFGIMQMVYEDVARPGREDQARNQARWDQ